MGAEMKHTKTLKSKIASKTILISGLIFLFLFIAGCSKNKNQIQEDTPVLTLLEGNKSELVSKPQKWHLTEKKVCILFGYNYNSEEVINSILEKLGEEFGLDEDGGLIYGIVYPTDFKHGSRSYATDFSQLLQNSEKDICALITLGAPENTHYALAKNQDFWNQNVPYPIVSLFPQDDVLGIEAESDIVIDKSQTAGITGELVLEEKDENHVSDIPEILTSVINYLLCTKEPFPRSDDLSKHAAAMLTGKVVRPYSDPETGLFSINHFVMEDTAQ